MAPPWFFRSIPSHRGGWNPPGGLRVHRGEFWWDLQPPFDSFLDEQGTLPLARWLAEGQADIVKTGPHRAVYRLMLPEGNFYLKHYRTPDWQAVLQNLVRPCKADLEWQAALRVREQGLSTFETIAIGRRLQWGLITDNFLISREIEYVRPLDEFIEQTLPRLDVAHRRATRQEIARHLGQLAAALHAGGLLHRDLHPGNVLIRHRDDQCELFLIDLHALSQKRRLSHRQMAENLSLLNNFFARRSSPADRWRFLRDYRELWNAAGHNQQISRESLRLIAETCRRNLQKADVRGDKKWRRGNRRLIILDSPSHRCRGIAELGLEQLESLKGQAGQLFDEPSSKNRQAVIELLINEEPRRCIVTKFPSGALARQAWEMGHALLRRQLPAPRPVLFLEADDDARAYLVQEEIPETVCLRSRLRDQFAKLSKADWQGWLHEVICLLAKTLRKLHEEGFEHTRLVLSSLLVSTDDPLRMWFGSLEDLRQRKRITIGLAITGFAELVKSWPAEVPLSRTVCLRFLRSYAGGRFRREWKTLWRGVADLANISHQEAA